MKNKVVIIILLILTLGLSGFIVYDKVIQKEAVKEFSKCSDNNESENEIKIKEVLDKSMDENNEGYIIELTDDNRVLVTLKGKGGNGGKDNNIIRRQVLSDVSKSFIVRAGQSDMCAGNTKMMFILNDGSVAYIDIDMLDCGQTIKVLSNVFDLENIVDITQEETKGKCYDNTDYCEPVISKVFVTDKNGNKTEITSSFGRY